MIQANPSNATADGRRNFDHIREVFHNGKHRKDVAFFVIALEEFVAEGFASIYARRRPNEVKVFP